MMSRLVTIVALALIASVLSLSLAGASAGGLARMVLSQFPIGPACTA